MKTVIIQQVRSYILLELINLRLEYNSKEKLSFFFSLFDIEIRQETKKIAYFNVGKFWTKKQGTR